MIEKIQKLLNNNFVWQGIILLGYRGSISHGTHQKTGLDDKDVLGICIPPKEYILGLKRFEQYEKQTDDLDLVVYDIRKYFRLLLNSNPNVISLLWLRPEHYIKATEWGKDLIRNRDIFLSKKCYKTFTGYAYSQLRKMESGQVYEGYMGEKRKRLVDKFGYDPKNASHLIRLLKMGIELLITGEVNVFRHDNQELLAIKNGEWELAKIKKEADNLFKLVAEAFVKSELPNEPDWNKANKLLIKTIENFWVFELSSHPMLEINLEGEIK